MQRRAIRILYLPNLFYPEAWNGIMEHLRLLISGLDPQRYEALVAIRPDDGTQTQTLAERTGARPCLLSRSRDWAEIRDVCRREAIDIVHIESPVTGAIPRLALGARLGGASLTIVTYQLVPPGVPRRSRMINRAVHRLLVDRTVAVSRGVAESLSASCGLDRSRINVIYNCVEPSHDTPSPPLRLPRSGEEVWIGYFGRLAKEKGVSYLIQALALLKERYPSVRTVLVGDGYEREALVDQARQLGLSDHLMFVGYQSDARALMPEVDIVVLPSLIEGFPLVLVEAMDAARPIVASRIPGSDEVVQEGVTGFLVPPADPQALAEALGALVGDSACRVSMGARGRQRFLQHFQSREMVGAFCGMYDELYRSHQ